jgi:hypothetical protein
MGRGHAARCGLGRGALLGGWNSLLLEWLQDTLLCRVLRAARIRLALTPTNIYCGFAYLTFQYHDRVSTSADMGTATMTGKCRAFLPEAYEKKTVEEVTAATALLSS